MQGWKDEKKQKPVNAWQNRRMDGRIVQSCRTRLSSRITNYALRITHYALHLTILLALLGVPTDSVAWVDGTPYFFEHFPNLHDLPEVPSAPAQPNAPQLAVGDRRAFFSIDFKTHEQYTLQATLRVVGEFCYIFVEDSQWQRTVNAKDVETVRRGFDEAVPTDASRGIYQIETDLLGPPPDTDGDERIYLLLLDIRDGANRVGQGFVAGFFSPIDQQRGVLRHPELGVPIRSNERDMLYIDTHPLRVGHADGLGVIAHEFQHLIHWRYDRDEEVWVNEGCSNYAMFICGYPPESHVEQFEQRPQISLIDWPEGSRSQLGHYGASYLWMLYLHERYGGSDTIAAIIKNRGNSIAGINAALRSQGATKTFPDIFADWKVANFLDDTRLENGQYGYRNITLTLRSRRTHQSFPASAGNTLDTYAADYITFSGSGGKHGLSLAFETDGSQPYDVKVVEFQGGGPSAVRDMPLTEAGKGHLIASNFGANIEKVILIPSPQPNEGFIFPKGGSSSYTYGAKLGAEVTFRTSVIPNPVHPRYWDIIALPSDQLGATPLIITITAGNGLLVSKQSMKTTQEGRIYTYPFYLSPAIHPETVQWRIQFFDEVIGEGRLVR